MPLQQFNKNLKFHQVRIIATGASAPQFYTRYRTNSVSLYQSNSEAFRGPRIELFPLTLFHTSNTMKTLSTNPLIQLYINCNLLLVTFTFPYKHFRISSPYY